MPIISTSTVFWPEVLSGGMYAMKCVCGGFSSGTDGGDPWIYTPRDRDPMTRLAPTNGDLLLLLER